MTDPDFDRDQRELLGATIRSAGMMEESVRQSLQNGRSIPIKAIILQLSTQLQQCQLVVEQHADGTLEVGTPVLSDVAKAMGAIHEAMAAVALVPPAQIQP